MDRLEAKLRSAASISKKQLHRKRSSEGINDLPGITDNAAFNTAAMPESALDQRSKSEKLASTIKSAGQFLAHPRSHAKHTATGMINANERPWLQEQGDADGALLELHDKIDADVFQLDGHINKPTEDLPEGLQRLKARLPSQQREMENINAERKELQATWHMSKYVRRARVVQKRPLAYPSREHYKQSDSEGCFVRHDWVTWLGHVMLYACQDFTLHVINPTNEMAYDKEVLITMVERLLVASGAFQLWWMRVRKVYMWDDPWLTGKWLAVFLVLLKTGYFMAFYWSYLLYSCLSNRYGRHTRQWMSDSHQRARDTHARAEMISELVVRHGKDKWLEPMLEEFGPWLQLQLGDTAVFLEMCASYYDWVSVRSTTASCCAYASMILLAVLTRLDYSMKVFWLNAGLYFFISRPIAAHYPRFRHTLDPLRWMYWDCPSTSEWAFGYLHDQAQKAIISRHKRELNTKESDDESDEAESEQFHDAQPFPDKAENPDSEIDLDSQPLLTFNGRWTDKRGSLELSAPMLTFTASKRFGSRKSCLWQRPYTQLLEIRKIKRLEKTNVKAVSPYGIGFLWSSGAALQTNLNMVDTDVSDDCTHVFGLSKEARDEIFNAVIGLSGHRWQELPRAPEDQNGLHRSAGSVR